MANPLPPPSPLPWPYTRSFRIEYADVDLLNHLNHAAYFRFMETLRCDYYLRLLGSLDPKHFDIIIAEAACRYLAPVAFDTELQGEVAPAGPLAKPASRCSTVFATPPLTGSPPGDVRWSLRTTMEPESRNRSSHESVRPSIGTRSIRREKAGSPASSFHSQLGGGGPSFGPPYGSSTGYTGCSRESPGIGGAQGVGSTKVGSSTTDSARYWTPVP